MKTILLLTMCFLLANLSAVPYMLTHGSFNSGGGHQSNSLYTNFANNGELFVGTISNDDFIVYLGFLFPLRGQYPPFITSIDDVPNDQGREVQIVWDKCAFDDSYDIETFYSIWREDQNFVLTNNDNPSVIQMATSSYKSSNNDNKKDNIHNLKQISSMDNTFSEPWEAVEQFRINPNKTYYWQRGREVWTFIGEVPALQYDEYSFIAPTLADSNSVDMNCANFNVVYHDHYQYYNSPPNCGYSVDDLPPDATHASVTKTGNNLKITWDEVTTGSYQGNSYEELNGVWYKIYAGDSPNFICDETSYITTISELNYDFALSGEDQKFFKIKVSDKPTIAP